ncbi:hypothetical protein C8J57DRAFT_1219756 [Mycena rebaudengoi]|nr:hypothetical protein C8J57DRAFT_1219756 [Mycena rebaudengoi]
MKSDAASFSPLAFLFLATCLILIAQLFWVCENYPSRWQDMDTPQCPLSRQVVIFQLISDVISDTILIVAPLQLLWQLDDKGCAGSALSFRVALSRQLYRLCTAALILTGGGPKVLIAAVVEDSVSLIVCNIPIVVTAGIHLLQSGSRRSPTSSSLIRFATSGQSGAADNASAAGDASAIWGHWKGLPPARVPRYLRSN